jgi:tRNA-intron endonuclease
MAKGVLVGDKVIVEDEKEANEIYNKGRYGEFVKGKLELSLTEALYLLDRGTLEIYDLKGKKLTFEKFVRKASKLESRFWTRFSVYRDIRSRGYITKTALKYGADFRVYERGAEPGVEHAKWLIYCVNENEGFDWKQFAAMNRVAHSVRKKLVVGIVDAEGDVTFYEIGWIRP